MNNLLDRIIIDADVWHGKACIRHMRWPVEAIRDLINSGMSFTEILADHQELERDDILAVINYFSQD